MRRIGVALKVALFSLVFLILWGPQTLSLRRNGPLSRRLPVFLHRFFLRLFGTRVTAKGSPPASGPTLVLANHASWLDIPVLGSLQPLSFVAKSEVAGWPVVGLFARLQRCVFLDRARRSATAKANAEIAGRLVGGEAIVLFPEGTSNDGNRVLPFRSSLVGAAQAALADPALQEIALQPLAIAYVRRDGLPIMRRDRPAIAWYGDMDLLPHLAGFLRSGPLDAVVVWGEPIPFGRDGDRKNATAAAEVAVRAALARATGRALPD